MSEVELAELAPDKVVDARGVACPGPLLEAKKGITGVAVGNVLEIWSSDPRDEGRRRCLGRESRARVPRLAGRGRLRARVHSPGEVTARGDGKRGEDDSSEGA